MPENTLFSFKTDHCEQDLLDLGHPAWLRSERVSIERDWRGRSRLRQEGIDWKNLTQVWSLWNERALLFRFECWYEKLNIAPEIGATGPIRGLWENDVVEVFLKPEAHEDYFEVEISPLGQWLDVHILEPRVDVNYKWESHLKLAVSIEEEKKIWRVIVALPFESLFNGSREERRPLTGDVWRLNLYRIAGEEPHREYLAWRPTFTPRPDFHVPSSFGNLFFVEE